MTLSETNLTTGSGRLGPRTRRAILIAAAFASAVSCRTETVAAQVYSGEQPANTTFEAPSAASTNGPVILRGSRPAPQPPSEGAGACPGGSVEEPGYGCVVPSYTSEPFDYVYWPYLGFGGGIVGTRWEFRHRFTRREFVHKPVRMRPFSAVRFHPVLRAAHGRIGRQ